MAFDPTTWFQLQSQLKQDLKDKKSLKTFSHKSKSLRVANGRRKRKARHSLKQAFSAISQEVKTSVALDFLAIGDSWFDYPINDDGIPSSSIAIISQLEKLGSPSPDILNFSQFGQLSTDMLSYENQTAILAALTDPTQTTWNNGKSADGILVSAGGNDCVGDDFAIYLDFRNGGGLSSRVEGIISNVQSAYLCLIALRDIACDIIGLKPSEMPIFCHTYDYAIPNGMGVKVLGAVLRGPWLEPSLNFGGYTYDEGLGIVKDVIDKFAEMLMTLAADPANYFFVIDTRNILVPRTSKIWMNELHPFEAGFELLAQKWFTTLQNHYVGRI
jgi:hypothetical protein